MRDVALEHGIGGSHVEPLQVTPAMRVEPDAQSTRRRDFGKPAADLERIGDLAAEKVDQDGERVVREGLVVHLGGAQRAAGIADQCVRHGAEAGRLAEIMRRGVGRVADEALGPGLALGARRAHRGGVGHHARPSRPRRSGACPWRGSPHRAGRCTWCRRCRRRRRRAPAAAGTRSPDRPGGGTGRAGTSCGSPAPTQAPSSCSSSISTAAPRSAATRCSQSIARRGVDSTGRRMNTA